METQTNQDSSKTMSAIDRALAAARARAEQRAAVALKDEDAAEPKVKSEKQPATAKIRKVKDEAEVAAVEEARAQRKASRDADREKRRSEKAATASEKKSHMKKVERAASKLPTISSAAESKLNEIRLELSNVELTALAAHILHHVRATATAAAAGKRPSVGSKVKIIGGDPKYFGSLGTVTESRPLRCFVDVPGVKKPIYLFNSDVSEVAIDESESN